MNKNKKKNNDIAHANLNTSKNKQKIKSKKKGKKSKRKLKLKYKKIIRLLLLLFFISVFLFSMYQLITFKKELKENQNEIEELLDEFIEPPEVYEGIEEKENVEEMKIDFSKLKQTNNDIVGWLVLNHKYVNNPIVQASDNTYYLNHSFKKKENSIGSIFMDYRNTSLEDDNVVLFGHHTPNNTMFGSLSDIFKKDYFEEENADMIYLFDLEHTLHKYQIFSYYTIEMEEYYITTSFENKNAFQEFITTIKNRSFGFRDVTVNTNDKILTLSTCAGARGTTKRRVIHAKRID